MTGCTVSSDMLDATALEAYDKKYEFDESGIIVEPYESVLRRHTDYENPSYGAFWEMSKTKQKLTLVKFSKSKSGWLKELF